MEDVTNYPQINFTSRFLIACEFLWGAYWFDTLINKADGEEALPFIETGSD